MKRPVIFSGTTEGRHLSEQLSAAGVKHIVCVATEYGSVVMHPNDFAEVLTGRMTALEMYDLIKFEADRVFDATHPYAPEVSHNILTACTAADIEYVRILRQSDSELFPEDADIHMFSDASACAAAFAGTEGNILLTTGSKELAVYAADGNVRERLYARVLPSHESLDLCEKAGLSGKHIIAMQGPFSKETDLALIRQFDIKFLVTKSSGKAGGAPDKVMAAAEAGIPVYMIGRPREETGISLREAMARYFGIGRHMQIDLIGTGPGRKSLLTADAAEAISKADMLFGASRMIEDYEGRKSYPYYKAADIIPVIEKERPARAAVLLSGDTGFYSGATKALKALQEWAVSSKADCDITVHPGISSFSYLAAKAGVEYSNAGMVSLHGRKDAASADAELIDSVRQHENTFVLLSGAADVKHLGELLTGSGLGGVRIILGYQMSYPEEVIGLIRPEDCSQVTMPGLYTAVVVNGQAGTKAKAVTPVLGDEDMIRGKVPMTKEEVRHLSIIKLGLTQGSVVYDIGSGTGSIACEIASLDPSAEIFAIEMKEEACDLIRQNADKLGFSNINVISGRAPEAFEGLPAPTHAFIGGSSGNLNSIIERLKGVSADAGIKVVINAVSLETIAEIQRLSGDDGISGFELEQISVSRSRALGGYHLMTAENPVMIASFTLGGCR